MLETTFKLTSYNSAIQPFCHHGTPAYFHVCHGIPNDKN